MLYALLAGFATQAQGSEPPRLSFNQHWVESLSDPAIDLQDPDAVFAYVFARLPDHVTVYPSENYYYFILNSGGKQVWGNIRLPAGDRDQGVLSFGYFEFIEFPQPQGSPGLKGSKYFGAADGVQTRRMDDLTYTVGFRGRSVTFHLHPLLQEPPKRFPLAEGEVFVERTFDESGYQFFLLFNDPGLYFLWVLNEEVKIPDTLQPQEAMSDLWIGKRSGFAFWVDREHADRKVLVAVRRLNTMRNDYYDGPFDQLADNYADQIQVSQYIEKASPALKGRIDKYGYYTDQNPPMRVALSSYYSYLAVSDLVTFLGRANAAPDRWQFVSRRGIPPAPARGASGLPAPPPPVSSAPPPPSEAATVAPAPGSSSVPLSGGSIALAVAIASAVAFWAGRRLALRRVRAQPDSSSPATLQ